MTYKLTKKETLAKAVKQASKTKTTTRKDIANNLLKDIRISLLFALDNTERLNIINKIDALLA